MTEIGSFGFKDSRNIDLLWPLVLKGDAAGSLNWLSGVISMDVSCSTWRESQTASDELTEAIRIYIHERFHAMQIGTMSFPQLWATTFRDIITPIAKRFAGGPGDFSGIRRMVNAGTACLTPEEARDLALHFQAWNSTGPQGISARCVLEGQAFFVERRTTYGIKRLPEWMPHLDSAPSPIYRQAYDFLTYWIGHKAFRWFSLACSLSLCTSRPGEAFERLATEMNSVLAGDIPQNQDEATQYVMGALLPKLLDLGITAAPEAMSILHCGHAQFESSSRYLLEKGFDFVDFFADPTAVMTQLVMNRDIPILFRPEPPSKLLIEHPQGMDEITAMALFMMGATANGLCRDVYAVAEHEEDLLLEQVAWMRRSPLPVRYTLSASDLMTGEPVEFFNDFPTDSLKERRELWGRLYFELPPGIGGDDAFLPAVPEARRLLRSIEEKCPAFPILLNADLGLVDWLGSVCDSDAVHENSIEINHNSVMDAARRAALAIGTFGRDLHQNTAAITARMTRSWFA
jgi:hypothetical protein